MLAEFQSPDSNIFKSGQFSTHHLFTCHFLADWALKKKQKTIKMFFSSLPPKQGDSHAVTIVGRPVVQVLIISQNYTQHAWIIVTDCQFVTSPAAAGWSVTLNYKLTIGNYPDRQHYKQAGLRLFLPLFFGICSSDRRARYTRTQTNSFEKEPSHHFEREKPRGIFF